MDPDCPSALTQLGEIELTASDYASAAEHYKHALDLKPDNAMIAFKYAKVLNLVGDDKGAIAALQLSLKNDPSQYEARLLLGEIYFQVHDAKDAQDQLEAALLLQSTTEATLKLAEVLIAQFRYSEAVKDLTPLVPRASGSPRLYDLLAAAYTGLHQTEDAQRARQRAKSLRVKDRKE